MSEISVLPQALVPVDKGDILSHTVPLFCLQVLCTIQHEQTKESQSLLKLCFKHQTSLVLIYYFPNNKSTGHLHTEK